MADPTLIETLRYELAIADELSHGMVVAVTEAASTLEECRSVVATALALIRISYGNLDEGINDFTAKGEALLTKLNAFGERDE